MLIASPIKSICLSICLMCGCLIGRQDNDPGDLLKGGLSDFKIDSSVLSDDWSEREVFRFPMDPVDPLKNEEFKNSKLDARISWDYLKADGAGGIEAILTVTISIFASPKDAHSYWKKVYESDENLTNWLTRIDWGDDGKTHRTKLMRAHLRGSLIIATAQNTGDKRLHNFLMQQYLNAIDAVAGALPKGKSTRGAEYVRKHTSGSNVKLNKDLKHDSGVNLFGSLEKVAHSGTDFREGWAVDTLKLVENVKKLPVDSDQKAWMKSSKLRSMGHWRYVGQPQDGGRKIPWAEIQIAIFETQGAAREMWQSGFAKEETLAKPLEDWGDIGAASLDGKKCAYLKGSMIISTWVVEGDKQIQRDLMDFYLRIIDSFLEPGHD